MLSDAQIDRYSRQILLPEVGGRGQERLLAAHVCLVGDGVAAAHAAVLLGRAGVGTLALLRGPADLDDVGPECRVVRYADLGSVPATDVRVDLAGNAALTAALGRHAQRGGRPHVVGTAAGMRGTVATLIGRPCGACLAPGTLGETDAEGTACDPAVALAVGALAASEALGALVTTPVARVQGFDLRAGTVAAALLPPAAGCSVCGGTG